MKSVRLKQSFGRALVTLMSGTVLSQLIAVGASPLLTRIYSPQQFGTLALFTAMAAVFSVVVAGRYEMAIMLPSEHHRAESIALLAGLLAISACALIAILAVFNDDMFADLIGHREFSIWVPWVPLFALLISLYKTASLLSTRATEYQLLSVSKISQAVFMVMISVSIGLIIADSGGLIYGVMSGQLAALFILLVFSKRRWLKIPDLKLLYKIKNEAGNYVNFPKFSMWGALCDAAALQVPVFVITRVFSSADVGYFSLSFRVLALPLAVVTTALSQIFLEKITRLARESPADLQGTIIRASSRLALAILPFSLVFLLFGESLFTLIFGISWTDAGRYSTLLVIIIAVRFVVSPMSVIFLLDRSVKLGSKWQVMYLVTLTSSLTLASSLDMWNFLIVFVVHEVVLYLIYFTLIIFSAGKMRRCAE